MAERGLSDRVTVLGADYRDLDGRYDALVSIEMIEAVDWRRHDEFFATCARLLTDRGRMALQAITIEDASYERAKLHDDFIRSMVFPGGCLPSVSAIAASVARTSNLRIVDLQDIGPHYAETLRRWRANLEDQRPAVERLGFDQRFWRFWTLYLCYCEAAFIERHVSDVQLVLARPGAPTQRARRADVTAEDRERRLSVSGAMQAVDHLGRGGVRRRRSSPLPGAPHAPRRRRRRRRRAPGRPGTDLVDGPHNGPHRAVVIPRGHCHGHRDHRRSLGDRTAERCLRDIGAEVDDIEAAAAQERSPPWPWASHATRAAACRGSRSPAWAPSS